MKAKLRVKGDIFRPVTTVQKVKNGVPTKVQFNGHAYALVHEQYINGNKNKFGKSKLIRG